MNQKQRDYLIKRLEEIKKEKKNKFYLEEPDAKPFIKRIKMASDSMLAKLIKNEFGEDYFYKRKSGYRHSTGQISYD